MDSCVQNLISDLQKNANNNNALKMAAYMKHHFVFFGIKTPKRRDLTKVFLKTYCPASTQEIIETAIFFWQMPQRECHYIAIELLQHHRKKFDCTIIEVYQNFTTTNSWWDSVDSICSNLLDPYFKTYPSTTESVTTAWNNSNNIWLQRNSIMFQKAFKTQTNTQLLEKFILNCAPSKEFFINKAIGWALRSFAKTNPSWVLLFVEKNKAILAPLSIKEATKRL